MTKTGLLNGRYRIEKEGKSYAVTVRNSSFETVFFYGKGEYSIPVPEGTSSITAALVGAGGGAGYGHTHKPDIFNTYYGSPGTGGSGAKIVARIGKEVLPDTLFLTVGAGGAARLKGGDTVVSFSGLSLSAGGGGGGLDGQGDGGSSGEGGAAGDAAVPENGSVSVIVSENGTKGVTGYYPNGANYAGPKTHKLNTVYYGSGGSANAGAGQDGAAVIIFYKE